MHKLLIIMSYRLFIWPSIAQMSAWIMSSFSFFQNDDQVHELLYRDHLFWRSHQESKAKSKIQELHLMAFNLFYLKSLVPIMTPFHFVHFDHTNHSDHNKAQQNKIN